MKQTNKQTNKPTSTLTRACSESVEQHCSVSVKRSAVKKYQQLTRGGGGALSLPTSTTITITFRRSASRKRTLSTCSSALCYGIKLKGTFPVACCTKPSQQDMLCISLTLSLYSIYKYIHINMMKPQGEHLI